MKTKVPISKREKVLVAMSGGVDSSVAAALMVKKGYEVIGVHLKFWADSEDEHQKGHMSIRENNCCSIESVEDARSVAAKLGIPFYVLNCRDYFKENIVDYFLSSFKDDITPNPCVMCNRQVKFGFLHDKMKEFGADFVASGHYARITADKNGNYILKRGIDNSKDQSYFLYNIRPEYLSTIKYPVGDMEKREVREIASKLGLRMAEKHDSQELCFVGGKDHREFLQKWSKEDIIPGEIVTVKGDIIGNHQGLIFYTIGQRKGIQTRIPRAWYVVKKDPISNRLVVGDLEDTKVKRIYIENVNVITNNYRDNVYVQVRYKSTPLKVSHFDISPNGKGEIVLEDGIYAVSKGQSAVLYSNDTVLAGGVIYESDK